MDLPVDIKAAKGDAEWKKESLKGHGDIYRHGLKHTTTSKPEKWWTTYFTAIIAVFLTAMGVGLFEYTRYIDVKAASNDNVARSLKEIEHVVIFMQENRSWNNYFGTMAGTRGFNDPNVQVNPDGRPVWYQNVNPAQGDVKSLLPWYMGHEGGDWSEGVHCAIAGSNGYQENQAALNKGENNEWVNSCTPWSWGYLKRQDVPVHFGIAEGWTVGDMYQQSAITATNPNRVMLASGSINVPGGPQTPDQGGTYLDNNISPGCPQPNISCYPLKWKTIFEFYEDAGVSWQIYQERNNFDDNPLVRFEQYQKAPPNSTLAKKGMSYLGLDRFYSDAKKGKLPAVSFIVGPMELSEHSPHLPKDGAWLQEQVVNAVTSSPKYGKTVLMISYDESGGWGDHVTPYHSPKGTPGEWMEDYLGLFGKLFVGPGWRLPFYIISPFTRGGRVFTEHSDHTSQIMFVEDWLTAKGYKNVTSSEVVAWRRNHMSNLVNALDFENADTSVPDVPKAETPSVDSRGNWNGASACQSRFTNPTVPYKSQPDKFPPDDLVEEGYKEVVGGITEGRYLVFAIRLPLNSENKRGESEEEEYFLSHDDLEENNEEPNLTAASQSPAEKRPYSYPEFRWVVHYQSSNATDFETLHTVQDGPFLLSNPDRSRWLGSKGRLVKSRDEASAIDIEFDSGIKGRSSRRGYTLKYADTADDGYIAVDEKGDLSIGKGGRKLRFRIFSVSYNN